MRPHVVGTAGSKKAQEAEKWLESLSPRQMEELASLDAHLINPDEEGVTVAKDWIEENGGEREHWYYLIWP